jgi:DNA-binding SARP family transcriptional activator
MIEIRTLGAVEVRDTASGQPVPALQHPRPLALLVRLALQEGPVRRDTLLPLFWPESDEPRARHALRQLILRVRRASGADAVVSLNSQAVQLRKDVVHCDAVAFRQAVAEGRRDEAMDLYAGEFMAGFHLPGASDFIEWLERTRLELRADAIGAARSLMQEAAAAGRLEEAGRYGDRVLELDPYDESCWREYLLLLARDGQGVRALLLFRRLVNRLDAELGLPPSAATLALARTLWPDEPPARSGTAEKTVELARTAAADHWRELRERAVTLSRRTLDAVKRRSGLPFELTLPRRSCARQLARFLRSDAAATAFIGPAGSGKSIALAHAVERLWLGPSAAYPNDVLWYVQSEDLRTLAGRGFDLPRWLRAQLGFGDDADVRTFFDAHPAARAGRVILLLDGLDGHALDTRTLDALTAQVLDVVASNRQPWFRVVVAMRVPGWQRLAAGVERGSDLARAWYGVRWATEEEDLRNVPPLRPTEVRRLMRRCWRTRAPSGATLAALTSNPMLREPGYLQLLLQAGSPAAPLDECRLVERYLEARVFAGPDGAARGEVLADFLRLGRVGGGAAVERRRLCAGAKRRSTACDDLLTLGVLRERQQYGPAGLPVAVVADGQPHVLDYLLVRHWASADGGLTPRMLGRLARRFEGSVQRVPLLEWAARLALRAGAYSALERIFELPLEVGERDHLARSLGCMLRQHDPARAWLLPRWAARESGRRHYFETFVDQDYLVLQLMEHLPRYIAAATDRQARVFGHAMMLLGSLLRLDDGASRIHRAALDALDPDAEIHPLPLGRAMAYRLLCHHLLEGVMPSALLDQAIAFALMPLRATDRFASFPAYHLFLMETLNLCGMPAMALDIAATARRLFPNLAEHRDRTVFYRLLVTHEAMALALAGHTDAARTALRTCARERALQSPQTYPSFHYATLQHRLAAAEIDARTDRIQAAISKLQLVVDASRFLRFRLFEARALGRLAQLHTAAGQTARAAAAGRRHASLLAVIPPTEPAAGRTLSLPLASR